MTAAPAAAPGAPPPADLAITEALVHALLSAQHPDLATLPLARVAAGWDNEMFRLGDDLCVRLPRRALAAPLVLTEQRWLPLLSESLPLPVPSPVRLGGPGDAYPWAWSVVPWFTGSAADLSAPGGDQATVLGGFLRALHRPAPGEAPRNPFRGVLADRAASLAPRFARLRAQTDLFDDALLSAWEDALRTPIDVAPSWIHGDLHPRNLLVHEGRLSAVIDWGDMAAGDPATDLAGIWMLLRDVADRERALHDYGPISAASLTRARGWAIAFGTILADAGRGGDARFKAIGERTLCRVVEGP